MVVLTSGTSDNNVNDITITATTGGSVQAVMPALSSVTQQAIFHTPLNERAIVFHPQIGTNKVGGASPVVVLKVFVYNRTQDTQYSVWHYTIDTSVENHIDFWNAGLGFPLSSGDVMFVTMNTTVDNTSGSFECAIHSYRNVNA